MNSHFHFIITGPECSGKTILSEALSKKYDTILVPEYSRAYLNLIRRPYLIEDLDKIALGQLSLEEEARSSGKLFSICDTDLTVLYIWSAYKYGEVSDLIENGLYSELDNKYYFLSYPDLKWEPDSLRENPHDRIELFNLYKKLLDELNVPYIIIVGDLNTRIAACHKIIQERGFIS